MLFCTSLIALVGAADQPQSSPRKLQIVNTKVGSDELLSDWDLVTNLLTAAVHDLRIAVPLLDTRSQTQPENSRSCP